MPSHNSKKKKEEEKAVEKMQSVMRTEVGETGEPVNPMLRVIGSSRSTKGNVKERPMGIDPKMEKPMGSEQSADTPKTPMDSNIMDLLGKGIVQRDNVYSYDPVQAEAKKKELISNRQDLFGEMKGLLKRGYGVGSDEIQSLKKEAGTELGVTPEAFEQALGRIPEGRKGQLEKFREQRDIRAKKFFEEMSQKRMSAQRRPTYSRFGDLRKAARLKKRGFGRAADALAARFALSPEAKAPAIASEAFLKERERIGEEARRAQGIRTRLAEVLLGNLIGEDRGSQGLSAFR